MYAFENIIGHEDIKEHLKNAIKLNKISHAYIFNGEKGIGKKLIANTFAKTLQCMEGKENPCNTCNSCRLYEFKSNPDISYITSSKIKSIGVEEIREQLNKDIYVKPYSFKRKIYIIEEAEKLTDKAQNTMLKTIEEPPEYAVIILLTTDIYKLLPTILSRCVIINFRPISDDNIMIYLNKYMKLTEEQLNMYVAFSQGNIGKIIELTESERFIEMRNHCLSIIEQFYLIDENAIVKKSQEIEKYKDNINDYIDLILSWFRDLLIVKSINEKDKLINRDKYNLLLKQAKEMSYNSIDEIIKLIENTKQQLFYNVNLHLAIELLLLKIKESY